MIRVHKDVTFEWQKYVLRLEVVLVFRSTFCICGRDLEWEMTAFCLVQGGGQSGGRVDTLSCGEVAGSLKARVGECSGDMVGML